MNGSPCQDVSIIAPAYNEAEGLPSLLERLSRLQANWPDLREVVVIDDGSTDATSEILKALDLHWLRVVRHERNLGLGAAFRSGVEAASGDILCMIDSDCTYPPERLPDFVAVIRSGAAIVTASPWHPSAGSDATWLRVFLSRGVSTMYRALTGVQLFTYSSMFRAYRREALLDCLPVSSGFPAVTETLLRALKKGYTVQEIPLSLGHRKTGESKMRLFKAVKGHLRLQWQWLRGDLET